MLFVENSNRNPYVNHALEEWLMERFDEDCFMLWRNEKAVLLGRNQNAYSELSLPYAQAQGIKIVRRITGGGAVYTDEGNLMFSFISCEGRRGLADFRRFAAPVLTVLQGMGVPAAFTGRNDMEIHGAKFSGNAQCLHNGKLLHHGTLMYSANTNELPRVLRVSPLKLRGKHVASVQSRVTNINEHMPQAMDIETFRAALFEGVMRQTADARLLRLSAADWEAVRQKAAEKHMTAAWIYGREPKGFRQKETKLPGGIVQVFYTVTDGCLGGVQIYGDFFGDADVRVVEEALRGVRHDAADVCAALGRFDLQAYFGSVSLDELTGAIV